MTYAQKLDGLWIEIIGSFSNDTGYYPSGWAEGATPEERKAAGFVEIVEDSTPDPANREIYSIELMDLDGVPTKVVTFIAASGDDTITGGNPE